MKSLLEYASALASQTHSQVIAKTIRPPSLLQYGRATMAGSTKLLVLIITTVFCMHCASFLTAIGPLLKMQLVERLFFYLLLASSSLFSIQTKLLYSSMSARNILAKSQRRLLSSYSRIHGFRLAGLLNGLSSNPTEKCMHTFDHGMKRETFLRNRRQLIT